MSSYMKSLLADMCAYLFTFLPPHILPWFNKVILSLWLTLFNTTETFLKTELSLTARSITFFSIESSWIVTAKRRTTMVLEERVLTSADLWIVWLEFLATIIQFISPCRGGRTLRVCFKLHFKLFNYWSQNKTK